MRKRVASGDLLKVLLFLLGSLLAMFLLVGLPLVLLSPWNDNAAAVDSRSFRGEDLQSTAGPIPAMPPVPMATPAPAKGVPGLGSTDSKGYGEVTTSGGSGTNLTNLEVAQRQIISTASVALEVESVPEAVSQVRGIAEGLGGLVETLSSSGKGDSQQANITVRIPQDGFFTALDRIKALGDVTSESAGSQDVTEQFIDMEARLKSAKTEEASLLSLLSKVTGVSDVLTIERELSRVRSEIERLQGQLNYLERRVDLSTITVSLNTPSVFVGQPPSASLAVETSDPSQSADAVKAQVTSLKGVVEYSSLSVRDGVKTARLVLRVFPNDFQSVLSSIESQGNVTSKDVQEGSVTNADKAQQPKDPNSRVEVTFVEKEGFWTAGHIVAIAAPVGGTLLAALVALAIFMAFKAGKRRAISS